MKEEEYQLYEEDPQLDEELAEAIEDLNEDEEAPQEEESPRDAKPTGAVSYVRGPNGNLVPIVD